MTLLISGCAALAKPPLAPPQPEPVGSVKQTDGARPPAPEPNRLAEQITRIAADLSELQNAVARLIVTSRDQEGQLQSIQRRLSELAAQSRDGLGAVPGGFAPSPRSPGQAPAPPVSMTTTATPEELYQAGLAKYRAGDPDGAVLIFYDLVASYPAHPLRESAQFMVADIFYTQKDFRAALAEFEALLAAVPTGPRTPDALLKIGLCQRGMGNEAPARRAWERIVKEYPGSVAARQARVLLRGQRPG
jgi:tol-pal system protein YbgF